MNAKPNGLVIWTFDWTPEGPRGFVRDIRLRWACEEAGLSYSFNTVSSAKKTRRIWRVSHSDRSPS